MNGEGALPEVTHPVCSTGDCPFPVHPSLALVSADLDLLQMSAQLLSMVGISLRDEGANASSQGHIVQENKP